MERYPDILDLRKRFIGSLNFSGNKKTKDVKDYCKGCTIYQQNKDSRSKLLNDPTTLELLYRRGGIICADLIVVLLRTRRSFDVIIMWADSSSRCDDTAADIENYFSHLFSHSMGFRMPLFWTAIQNLCQNVGKN